MEYLLETSVEKQINNSGTLFFALSAPASASQPRRLPRRPVDNPAGTRPLPDLFLRTFPPGCSLSGSPVAARMLAAGMRLQPQSVADLSPKQHLTSSILPATPGSSVGRFNVPGRQPSLSGRTRPLTGLFLFPWQNRRIAEEQR